MAISITASNGHYETQTLNNTPYSGMNFNTTVNSPVQVINQVVVAKQFAYSLKQMKICLVAFDFDQTIVAIHTHGLWMENENEIARLSRFVRPMMIELIRALLENHIYVAIVSFSPQLNVIRSTLQNVLSSEECNKLFIQCYNPHLPSTIPIIGGKEDHLVAVVSYIQQVSGQTIYSRQILLIDDDKNNINTALAYGHYVIHYNEDVQQKSWLEMSVAYSSE
ncbi:hypothetical protein GJ496_004128 [Pomphorhynchus laevis]|nr:hypothetical protein GJ496_004128 [Pomphorhynchus laevis]